jgi:hypothetical protein
MMSQPPADWGPWPGPRPYREADRQRFFGRDDEQEILLERLDAERLVLVTAPSAVGKTSFLRAAIVPELRRRRCQALERGQPSAQPAVIVVRDWPIPDLADSDGFFIRAVAEGIEDLKEESASYAAQDATFMLEDYRVLQSVDEGSSAYEYIVNLARATQGLTLVLDQFEEALQGSTAHASRVSQLVGWLYKQQPSVRLLLSFREEFLLRLSNGLDRQFGDLAKRTMYLRPLGERTVREALMDAAKGGNVNLERRAVDELLSWMEKASTLDDKRRTGRQRVNRARHGGQYLGTNTAINLLKLQALLLLLYEVALQSWDRSGEISITLQTLERLKRETVDSENEHADGTEVVERALQHFIDRLLPLPEGQVDAFGLPKHDDLDSLRTKMLRRRRAAARMGPSFSSGGFKVQQEQAALLARAWREDWEVIGIDVNEVEDALTDIGDLEVGMPNLFEGMLPDAGDLPDVSEEMSRLSGIARAGQWSIRNTAIDLIERSIEALEILREGNVLRRKSLQGHVTYELVHDGFGDALFDWAEAARAQPLDAMTATTAERGTAFRWTRLTGTVKHISWRGCWVGPDPDRGKRLLIDNVTFQHCDLRGTVFDSCDFRGGGFHECNLGGVEFWDCTFTGTSAEPFCFSGVVASGVSFGDNSALRHVRFSDESRLHNMSWNRVTVEHVLLDRCIVNQMTIGQITLVGQLSLHHSWILLSDLVGLGSSQSEDDVMLNICDCDLFFCRLDVPVGAAVDSGSGNRRFPEPAHVRSEPKLRDVPLDKDPWLQPL